jgi:ADP-ribose pyrophosphatase YjhB (NUDIX family)
MKRRLADWLKRSPLLRWGLKLAVRLFAPRHFVGAVGAVFNNTGQVLLAEHVFRPNYNWGLPGGWIEPGEDPAEAVQRELEEELGLKVEIRRLLICQSQGDEPKGITPRNLGLVYYCRLTNHKRTSDNLEAAPHAYEILSTEWVDPEKIERKLLPLYEEAIALAREEFEREQKEAG